MKTLKDLFSESKNYILFATLLFLFGAWMGYVYNQMFTQLIALVLEQLEEIKEVLDQNQSPEFMTWLIFKNNATAALMMIGLGLVVFFAPAITLFVNGLAVGYVLKVSAVNGISPTALFLYGILPHGILELPAIIIAGGVGIFLGWRLLRFLFHWIGLAISAEHNAGDFFREQGLPVLKQRVQGVAILIALLIGVLFLAAVVESYVTPALLEDQLQLQNIG